MLHNLLSKQVLVITGHCTMNIDNTRTLLEISHIFSALAYETAS